MPYMSSLNLTSGWYGRHDARRRLKRWSGPKNRGEYIATVEPCRCKRAETRSPHRAITPEGLGLLNRQRKEFGFLTVPSWQITVESSTMHGPCKGEVVRLSR